MMYFTIRVKGVLKEFNYMQKQSSQINDKWVRIGGIALLSINMLLNLDRHGTGVNGTWFFVFYYLVSIVLILEFNRYLIRKIHQQDAAIKKRKRFWKAVLACFTSTTFLFLVSFYGFHLVRGLHVGDSYKAITVIIICSMVLAMVHAGIYEAMEYSRRLGMLEAEKEELLRINLQGQYDALKQQVNPHFLFNSINTVSSLITKDPVRAQKFLSEMSKVYRYLLQSNEEELVTLETELKFIGSYFHLLKTRFTDGLFLDLQIEDDVLQCQVPALTLQLLIENAIKHNIVEKETPLVISMISGKGQLTVRNNLQKKLTDVVSTRIGLANIIAKYKLLGQPEVIVLKTENDFTVTIPLIQSKMYEHTNS
jgi:two-component system, LytTR family, sensor kinase